MYYSDDPGRDYDRYDRDREGWLSSRPICSVCGEYIQDDTCYEFDVDLVCQDCLREYCESNYKKVI